MVRANVIRRLDLERFKDDQYNETIERYGLQVHLNALRDMLLALLRNMLLPCYDVFFALQHVDDSFLSGQDISKFSHLIPKLWFEPYSTDSLEDGPALHDPLPQDEQPHT